MNNIPVISEGLSQFERLGVAPQVESPMHHSTAAAAAFFLGAAAAA